MGPVKQIFDYMHDPKNINDQGEAAHAFMGLMILSLGSDNEWVKEAMHAPLYNDSGPSGEPTNS